MKATNYIATYALILPDEATNPTTIRVSEMYYSDHADGSSKTIVNTNDKEVYKVYTLDGIYVDQTRYGVSSAADFKITKNEGLTVKSVSFNDKELEFDGEKKVNKYTVNETGKLVVKYSYSQDIGNIPGIDKDEVVLEKNIELFSKDWFQPYEGKYINVDSIEYTTDDGEKQVEYYTFILFKFPSFATVNQNGENAIMYIPIKYCSKLLINKYNNPTIRINGINAEDYNRKTTDNFQELIGLENFKITLNSEKGVISCEDVSEN